MAGHIKLHGLGDSDNHSSCTVAELNDLISDGTFGGGLHEIVYQTGVYTSTDTAWTNVNNNMILTTPVTGTYKVTANMCVRLFGATVENASCELRFHNTTVEKGSALPRNYVDPISTDWNTSIQFVMTIVDIFECTASELIYLQAKKYDTTTSMVLNMTGVMMMELI